MKVEQISNAGMQSGSPSFSSTGQVQAPQPRREFQTHDVFVKLGDEKIKIGEYPEMSEVQIKESVENMNKELKTMETNLQFSVHKQTKQILVKIINSSTNEVIKEIPSEKILDMVAAMMERAGLILDKRG